MKLNEKNFKQRGEKLKLIKSIREIIDNGNFSLAIKQMKFFLENYGEDCEVLYLYGKLLRKTERIHESIAMFKKLLIYQKESKLEQYALAANMELFKVYFINDYYQEAYEIFKKLKGKGWKKEYWDEEVIEKILKIKLGIYEENLEGEPLVIEKMLHYCEDVAREHAKKHLYFVTEEWHSMFKNIDFDDLFERVKKALPDAKRIQRFSINDVYLFRFCGIGTNDCDLLQVVTNKGTHEIVTLYPTNTHFIGTINENLYEKYLDDRQPKTKQISQIDRFQKRYNL